MSRILIAFCASGSKEGAEEKSKGPSQKIPVVQRGRFSVTSDDVGVEVSLGPRKLYE